MSGTGKKRLGELLVTAGVIDEEKLSNALKDQKKWGGRLGKTLIDLGYVDEATMVVALSRQLGLSSVDFETTPIPRDVTSFVGVDVCERCGVFPIAGDRDRKTLKLAMSDPTSTEIIHEVNLRTGLKIEPLVASASDIDRAIRRWYYGETSPVAPALLEPEPIEILEVVEELPLASRPATSVPGRPLSTQLLDGDDSIRDLAASVLRMEEVLTSELKALRCLVEMLVERGVISHEEYVRRVRGK